MKFGIAVDLRARSGIRSRLDELQAILDAAVEHGLDSVWVGESYMHRVAKHVPSPLIVLANLATRTPLCLGTGVLLARTYHPARLWYDATMLHDLSDRRVILGIGLGNLENQALAGWSRRAGGMLFDDVLNYFADQRTDPVPTPSPDILVGGAGDEAIRRATTKAHGYYAATNYSDRLLHRQSQAYWRGISPASTGNVAVNRLCLLADDEQEAEQLAARFLGPVRTMYARRSAWNIGAATPSEDDPVLVGTPEQVARRIREYERWGVTRVHLRVCPVGTPEAVAINTLRLTSRL